MNFCTNCGEMRWIIFFTALDAFFYINLPQQSMQWVFVRKAVNVAVNICKKCDEMWWNIYCHRIHRNHRISFKNSPHSPHFLQKFTRKPRPGNQIFFVIPQLINLSHCETDFLWNYLFASYSEIGKKEWRIIPQQSSDTVSVFCSFFF